MSVPSTRRRGAVRANDEIVHREVMELAAPPGRVRELV